MSYFNDTQFQWFVAGMHLVYIHFSNFDESYEILGSTCAQICLLMHVKFSGFGLLTKIIKIC